MKETLKSASNYKGMMIQQMVVANPRGEEQTEWRIVLLDAANINHFVLAASAKDAEIKIDTGEAENNSGAGHLSHEFTGLEVTMSKRIMVVEDDQGALKSLVELLESSGYDVWGFESAESVKKNPPADVDTKRNLADYYQVAAPFMLPHVVERPLALMRCPAGLATRCFFMRNWSESLPEAVDKVKVAIGKNESHVMIHDAAGLFSLVQISALEIHTWNCHVDDMIHPDQIVFDLDPGPEVTWKQIVKAARILREVLGNLGLTPFVKTSGGKGLHLTVPIVPTVAWKEVKAFCRTIAEFQAGENELFVANMRKELRHGKIYIDYLRNDQGSTAVAPYSARARAGAAVSIPLAWDEIDSIKSADHLTIKNAGAYLAKRKDDPWAEFDQAHVDLHKIVNQAPTKKKEE